LKALALKRRGNLPAARAEMDQCLSEADKLYHAATRLGIEFPLSVHDDEVVDKYREIRRGMQ
jgi:hypothetical protein